MLNIIHASSAAGWSSGFLLESTENIYRQNQTQKDAFFKAFLNAAHHHPACRCTAQTSDEANDVLGVFLSPRWPATSCTLSGKVFEDWVMEKPTGAHQQRNTGHGLTPLDQCQQENKTRSTTGRERRRGTWRAPVVSRSTSRLIQCESVIVTTTTTTTMIDGVLGHFIRNRTYSW